MGDEENVTEEEAVDATELADEPAAEADTAELAADTATDEAEADPAPEADPEPEAEESSDEDASEEDEVPVATGARTVQQAHVNAQQIQAEYRAERMRAKRAKYLPSDDE